MTHYITGWIYPFNSYIEFFNPYVPNINDTLMEATEELHDMAMRDDPRIVVSVAEGMTAPVSKLDQYGDKQTSVDYHLALDAYIKDLIETFDKETVFSPHLKDKPKSSVVILTRPLENNSASREDSYFTIQAIDLATELEI